MRSAAASFDDDFGYDAPARKKPVRKAGAGKPGKKKKTGKRFSLDRVARYGAIGMSLTVGVGIVVNALMMQTGHHPAPLFGTTTMLGTSTSTDAKTPPVTTAHVTTAHATTRVVAPSVAPASPAAAPTIDSLVSGKTSRPATSHDAPTVQPDQDAIARLLLKGSGASADNADSKTVLGVQKALAKLGFAVKTTGTIGPATKKAIESFERDRHLPVNGDVSRRLVKVLAAESGIRID